MNYSPINCSGSSKNDFWLFNSNQEVWYWMAGPSSTNASPVFSTISGIEDQTGYPGAMQDAYCYINPSGSLNLFGPSSTWRYSSTSKYWTSLSQGTVTNSVYGQANIKSVGSKMSFRWNQPFVINNDLVMLFGGNTSLGVVDELWIFDPCSQVYFSHFWLTSKLIPSFFQ
jgi:hypothetical protein